MSIIRDWIRLVGFYLIWGMFDIVISYIKSTIWFKIVENESFEFFLFFFYFFLFFSENCNLKNAKNLPFQIIGYGVLFENAQI